jgi:hypothetical protein
MFDRRDVACQSRRLVVDRPPLRRLPTRPARCPSDCGFEGPIRALRRARRSPPGDSVELRIAGVDDANQERQLVSDYVTVERADNEAMAELIKQRLEQGGIPCVVQSGRMAAVAGAGAAYAVTVPAENVDEARQILAG